VVDHQLDEGRYRVGNIFCIFHDENPNCAQNPSLDLEPRPS
jgi:hypothetical protein